MASGANAGNSAGNAITNVFKGIGGAGEVIRGETNTFVDNIGEAIAGRKSGTDPVTGQATNAPTTDAGSLHAQTSTAKNEAVAERGKEEVRQGLGAFQKTA